MRRGNLHFYFGVAGFAAMELIHLLYDCLNIMNRFVALREQEVGSHQCKRQPQIQASPRRRNPILNIRHDFGYPFQLTI